MSYMKNENFIKAVRYIFDHIDEAMTVTQIAQSVGVSESTLKRLFKETIGQTPGQFVRRMRMDFALRTLNSRQDSILEVALRSGFENQSAFTRRFKETFGYSPKESRQKHNIVHELESIELEDPEIITLQRYEIQSVTEQGIYFECAPKAWQVLKRVLNGAQDQDDFSGVFIGIGHDNPHDGEIAYDQVRFSAGVALHDQDLGLATVVIDGGPYARFHFRGNPNNLGMAYHYIYGKWEKESDYQINHNKPGFMMYETFPEPIDEYDVLLHIPIK